MSCEDYLKDISRASLLTGDEEITLGNTVQAMMKILENKRIEFQLSAGNLKEIMEVLTPLEQKIIKNGLRARNRMITANMRLVVAIAKKYVKRQVHMTMQDLIQEGAIGLTRAAEKFEPSRGYKFSTYAYLWIKQGITRGCEAQEGAIKIPAHLQRMIRKARETSLKMSAALGREPSLQELADELGEMDQQKLRSVISMYAMMSPAIISTDILVRPDDGKWSEGFAKLCDAVNTEDESEIRNNEEDSSKLEFIKLAINALDPLDRELVMKKYGINCEPASIKQLAKENSLTPQAVRDRQNIATAKIRYIVTNFADSST
jgi:RNA polymerase nonessential primary-like sigma factor